MRVVYAGTPEFSVPALQTLIDSPLCEVVAVYTQPDRPAGRGRALQPSPVKRCALAHSLPVCQPDHFRTPFRVAELTALQPDLMVVTAYGLLLPAEVLRIPRLGCVNIHASLLPRWRGAAPIQRAILAGDRVTGITLMQMDEGLDTGDMLVTASCEIRDDDTGSRLHDRLMQLGASTLHDALPGLIGGRITGRRQDETQACYATKLSKAEARIDWGQPAAQIERAVRAFNAWPVAYTGYRRKGGKQPEGQSATLRVWQARAEQREHDAAPGTVLAEDGDGVVVAAGSGVLRLLEIQPQGKRRMPVADFLNAASLLGQRLGADT